MKALILVDNVNSVPAKFRQRLLVITQSNWQEIYSFLDGMKTDQHIFIHENAPLERLLKMIEDYQGNMAIYTSNVSDLTMMSRFTSITNRRTVEIRPLELDNPVKQKLARIKRAL